MNIYIVTIFFALLLIRIYLKLSIRRCVSKASMVGKVIIVTGANAGIGYHTAKDIAARGGKVILACRNEKRGLAARNQIIAETGNSNVVFMRLDLASLDSVRKFADNIAKTENRLDVLVNNAGIYGGEDRYTEDGIVEGMQVNYFGPFLLTLLLLPLLKKTQSSRIVNLTSLLYLIGVFNKNWINMKNSYHGVRLYANSKLCNLIFTVELAKRLKGTCVTTNAVHPGVIKTSIINDDHNIFARALYTILCWICSRSAELGAATTIHVAVSEECEGVSGKYFSDCRESFMSWHVNSESLAKDLWELSEKLVGLNMKKSF